MGAHQYLPLLPDWFRSRVSAPSERSCWLWTGKVHALHGHGILPQCSLSAHRFSYEQHKGRVPPGHRVVHTCDGGRRCVNPGHLALRKDR